MEGELATRPIFGWCPNSNSFTTESQSHGEHPNLKETKEAEGFQQAVGVFYVAVVRNQVRMPPGFGECPQYLRLYFWGWTAPECPA